MVPKFDVEILNTLGKLIGKLERFSLEKAIPEEFDPRDLLEEDDEQAFFQVKGLANFWKGRPDAEFGQHLVDLVIGIHNQHQSDLLLILLGTPRKLSLFISLGNRDATQTILEGIFPGIVLQPVTTTTLLELLPAHFLVKGVITGIPDSKTLAAGTSGAEGQAKKNGQAAGNQGKSQLERVIRGMHGKTWAYIVKAHPRPRHKVVEERMVTIDMLTQVTNHSRMQWSSTKQENLQLTTRESGGMTQSYSGDLVNYRAQYLIKLLERALERHDQAAAAGQWTVSTYFGAESEEGGQRLSALLLGTLAGPDSRPEPLRAMLCQRKGQSLDMFETFLTSQELAALIQLPREEVPGYAIHEHVSFDVDFQNLEAVSLPLGTIQQNGKDTQGTFDMQLAALAKHVVVIGVTGSGKTTTVMNLLDRVARANKPFLVIEPAKTEYRSLHSALPPGQQLRVYTLGNEMIAPFRLNPFEFETGDEPGTASLLAHIDFLKAVFNAAFVLYSPMPQVLEEALYEVYEDKGWDLTSGTNRRLAQWSDRHHYPIFPTLTDLYSKVEEVTKRLGYDKEVESNVQAGLKTRVGSLRLGSKGLMLDTPRGISMQALLSHPTVLELENIGNDDEKTFIMGLFLARLYEYRRLLSTTNAKAKGLSSFELQHLMVFEEAHRLLQNTSTQVGAESSNPRAQAIELFTNMLSEMRAYGQGVLVAEQIPSKLAPDVLKNTNLKIVHRLIAKDDRESIGHTMNLSEEQLIHLGVLNPGMAVVYAEGVDHAYLVRMENYKRQISALIDTDLFGLARLYASVKPYLFISNIADYDLPFSPMGGPDPAAYHAAGKLLDSPKSKWLWSNILIRLIADPTNLHEMILRFTEHIEAEMPYLTTENHDIVRRLVVIRGCAQVMQERGARLGWSYEQVEQLRILLTRGILKVLQAYQQAYEVAQLRTEEAEQKAMNTMDEANESFVEFINLYATLSQRRQGPFVGCVHCQAKCFYRIDVHSLLSSKDSQMLKDKLESEDLDDIFVSLARSATFIARKWLGSNLNPAMSNVLSDVAYCAVAHALMEEGIAEYDQALVADKLKNDLLHLDERKS